MKNITPTIKMNWLTLIIIFIGFYSISQTSQVDVEINWPQWSGENYVIIYDNAGNEIIRICNPTNCYNGSSVAYSTTIDLGCLPNGTYRARLWDRYNDGWNGSGYIRITSGGSVVFDQTYLVEHQEAVIILLLAAVEEPVVVPHKKLIFKG
ncbi:probable aggregation factor core protein MAFp3 [Nonlabens tegetincola]|uniref:Probable aggregation factor core protein MAFp3 n=1 Tax=Nonlabens tegetincola TaxID=323273 RepID=A0A090QRL3_9FLAO|nr:hypothetical protein [Nonlabens tegetincola]GAK98126.1 probable aggregation factor core protein MAFp3 [Nonlabens tegetincola]